MVGRERVEGVVTRFMSLLYLVALTFRLRPPSSQVAREVCHF